MKPTEKKRKEIPKSSKESIAPVAATKMPRKIVSVAVASNVQRNVVDDDDEEVNAGAVVQPKRARRAVIESDEDDD